MRTVAGRLARAALLAWPTTGLWLGVASTAPGNDRSAAVVSLAAGDAEDVPDFNREIKPLLVRHCYRCHGPQRQESGYRLDQKEAAFRGGNTGEQAIVPGDADNSPLIQYIRGDDPDFVMPPEGERLTERDVQRVVRWVEKGAPWP